MPRILFLFLFFALNASAQVDWPIISFKPVGTNSFQSPTHITHAGDGTGRLFITEQGGRVWIAVGTNVLPAPFLNIAGRILLGAEWGLFSIAFPPNYSTNHAVYVNYTRAPDGATVVSRFSTEGDLADTNSEQVLLTIPQPYPNHNGGQLAFGPDGSLYIGTGDGGYNSPQLPDPFNYAQNPSSLLGKILRIDTGNSNGISPYRIPPSNPFIGDTNYAPEIWAFGLRNPWRFSFDRLTGDLYIGDVGHNTIEEINFQAAGSAGGQNYGWRGLEGFDPPPLFWPFPLGFDPADATYPIATYPRLSGASVTGGFVCRAPNSGRLHGFYIFGDFMLRSVFAMARVGTNWQFRVMTRNSTYSISTFGEDESGTIYLADYSSGRIYRIDDTGEAYPPTFSPASTTLNSEFLSVDSLTPNSTIHYTTNGITPTPADPGVQGGGQITVVGGANYQFRAFRNDLLPSVVTNRTFTLQVAAPAFAPSTGPITNGTTILITNVTPNAVTRYTLDGTEPNELSAIYSGPFIVNGDVSVKAKAYRMGFAESVTHHVFYALVSVAPLSFTPSGGPISNRTEISISSGTPMAAIHYTTNGSDPTQSDSLYAAPFYINGNTTVKARAYRNEYHDSAIKHVFYPWARVAGPLFSPASGAITNATPVTITSETEGALIHFTTNGAEPTVLSPIYQSPVPLLGNTLLKAIAFKDGWDTSVVSSTSYALISRQSMVVTTVAGTGVAGTNDGDRSVAQFSSPHGVCVDPVGNIYVADRGNRRIRKIAPNGIVSTLAGSGITGISDGTGTNAQFAEPIGICIDGNGILYVADCQNIRRVTPQGVVTTIGAPSACSGFGMWQLAIDRSTNFYFGRLAAIFQRNRLGGLVWEGGHAALYCANDWCALNNAPAPAIDAQTNLYVASGNQVHKFDAQKQQTLFAGSVDGYNDGWRTNALFSVPRALFANLDSLYVSESSRIRHIRGDGWVTTAAGTTSGFLNGHSTVAQFNNIQGICTDSAGNIYVADAGNHRVRMITADVDHDAIPDNIEGSGNPFAVGVDDRLVDSDGDGASNADEYRAGSDANNLQSVLRIYPSLGETNYTPVLRWSSSPGRLYTVQRFTDNGSWQNFSASITGDGSFLRFTDTNPITTEFRMFRLQVNNP